MFNSKKSFILVMILFMTSIYAKPSDSYVQYYKLMIDGMTLEANDNYKEAYESYTKAFDTAYPFVDDVSLAIGCCKKAGFSNEIPSLIQKLVLCGYKRETDNIRLIAFEDGQYSKHINNREFEYPEYEDYLNSVYDSCRAVYMKRIDQESDRYLSAFNHFELFTIFMRRNCSSNKKQRFIQDAAWGVSCQLLLDLYRSGMIDIRRQNTDTWNDGEFLACLIHIGQESPDLGREEEYFSFLRQMVLEGNLYPRQYAQIKDAVIFRETGKCRYGESLSFDATDMRLKVEKLENPAEVDKMRAELFISPLWVIAKLKNYILPVNYKN